MLAGAAVIWLAWLQAKLWENSSVWSIADTMQLRVTSGFAFLSAILYFVYAWCVPQVFHMDNALREHA